MRAVPLYAYDAASTGHFRAKVAAQAGLAVPRRVYSSRGGPICPEAGLSFEPLASPVCGPLGSEAGLFLKLRRAFPLSCDGVLFDPQQVVGPCREAHAGGYEPPRHSRDRSRGGAFCPEAGPSILRRARPAGRAALRQGRPVPAGPGWVVLPDLTTLTFTQGRPDPAGPGWSRRRRCPCSSALSVEC